MGTHSTDMRVVVIGGGIAGLSAAWTLQQAGVRCTVLEASERWGGKVFTERIATPYGEFVIEAGADAFLTRKPWALQLARELGLGDAIQYVNKPAHGTLVLNNGKLIPLPDGLSLLVPTKVGAFARSPLFTLRGKLRMLLEYVIPARHEKGDESLASFVRRRFGSEALDKLAEPLLAGIYNSETERQSLGATFPQFADMEREYGSLLRATRQNKPATSYPAPAFFSFRGGTQTLVDALAARLDDGRLNTRVERIRQQGEGYAVELHDRKIVHACAIVMATPAKVAAPVLRDVAPDAADGLAALRTTSIASMALAFRRDDVPHELNALGVVMPPSEGRRIDGMTWVTSKWNHRAPEGYVLIRVFYGGPHTHEMIVMNDADAEVIVRQELRDLLGIEAPPLLCRVHHWEAGYPQYDVRHLERVSAIEAALPPDIAICGSPYRGIGVPDCVRQGREAAEHIAATLRAGTVGEVAQGTMRHEND